MSRIILATESQMFEQRVRRAFSGTLNGDMQRWLDQDMRMGNAQPSLAALADETPELLVLGPDIPVEEALLVARAYDRERPEISVVIVAVPTPDIWEQALRAGVRDVIDPAAPDEYLRKAFDQAIAAAARRKSVVVAEPPAPGPRGRVITLVGPKGGAGKTALASNLAAGLAERAPGEVVLVDLDLQFGDVQYALQLRPEHTFADIGKTGGLDLTTVKVFLTVRDRNLYVLCAPHNPAAGEEVPERQVRRTLALLAAEFPYVVIDTSAGINEHTLAALELSTDLLLVCDLSVSSVRGLAKVVEALDTLEMSEPRRHLVLNRANSRVGLDPKEVADTIGMPIDVEVPSARDIPLSMNRGTPVIEAAPRTQVARKLVELVDRLAVVPQPADQGARR